MTQIFIQSDDSHYDDSFVQNKGFSLTEVLIKTSFQYTSDK